MVDHLIHNCSDDWIIDELTYCLGLTKSFHIEDDTGTIHIFHKYYDQAEWILPRLNVWEPPPEFVVYESDLTPKLRAELTDLRSTPESLSYLPRAFIEGNKGNFDYDKEKYRDMLLEAAETVLSIFGFNRTVYGDAPKKYKKWWQRLNEDKLRDRNLEMI